MKKLKTIHILYIVIGVLICILLWILIGRSTSNGWISKQQIFENDLKCQEQLENYKDSLKGKWYTDIFVFYSPIENSCFWTFQSYKLFNNSVRYNWYWYTIENLSNLHEYVYFEASSYYSGDNLITINHMTNTLTNSDCSDIDYRYNNTEEDKEYYKTTKRCNFDNAREAYQKELEYLKGN